MRTYAYIRVSTDDQTVENQRDMIRTRGFIVDEWLCDQGVSGTKSWRKRDIAQAVDEARSGDRIVVAELSRLGRSLRQVLEIVEICRDKGVEVVMVREGLVLADDNPTTKLLVSVIGACAEMERNLISQRTKDALELRRKQGIVLGRPKGRKTRAHKRKLSGREVAIKTCRRHGLSKAATARALGVSRSTLQAYCNEIGGSLSRVFEGWERDGRPQQGVSSEETGVHRF